MGSMVLVGVRVGSIVLDGGRSGAKPRVGVLVGSIVRVGVRSDSKFLGIPLGIAC